MESGFEIKLTDRKRVFVRRMGSGKRLAIALHGFGRNGAYFSPMGESGDWEVLAPDLPFHGRTLWEDDRFRPEELLEVLDAIRQQTAGRRFSLLGHSMGGRLALGLSGSVLPWLEGLFLLAPDGLQTSGVGWLDNFPGWGITLLEKLSGNPGGWIRIIERLQGVGMVSAANSVFVRKQFLRPELRRRTFGCWRSLPLFRRQAGVSKKLLAQSDSVVGVVLGASDPLVQPRPLERWLSGMPQLRTCWYEGEHDPVWEQVLPCMQEILASGTD